MHKRKIDGSPRHISLPWYETLSKSDKRFWRNAADKFIFKVSEEEEEARRGRIIKIIRTEQKQ